MDYLVFAWQDDSPDNSYYLDTESGDIKLVNRHLYDIDDLTDEIEREHDRYLYLPKPDPSNLKIDIHEFWQSVKDQKLKSTLEIAFESSDILGTFKKILASNADELSRFGIFRNERIRKKIEQWLHANSISYESK